MAGANTVPTKIVDKNGKQTTVYRKVDESKTHKRNISKKPAREEENTYFQGKPEWFRDYAFRIADAVVKQDTEFVGFFQPRKRTERSLHIEKCGISDVWSVYEDIESEYVFNTFDADAQSHNINTSVILSCNCGTYSRDKIQVESDMAELVESMFRS